MDNLPPPIFFSASLRFLYHWFSFSCNCWSFIMFSSDSFEATCSVYSFLGVDLDMLFDCLSLSSTLFLSFSCGRLPVFWPQFFTNTTKAQTNLRQRTAPCLRYYTLRPCLPTTTAAAISPFSRTNKEKQNGFSLPKKVFQYSFVCVSTGRWQKSLSPFFQKNSIRRRFFFYFLLEMWTLKRVRVG